jgi:hypothetical protein
MTDAASAVSAIQEASSVSAASSASAAPAVMSPDQTTALSQKFDHLMAQASQQSPDVSEPSPTDSSTLSDFVRAKEDMLGGLNQKLTQFTADAPHLNMDQMTTRGVEMMMTITQAQMQFTGMTSLAGSAKSGLQTLVKNQ